MHSTKGAKAVPGNAVRRNGKRGGIPKDPAPLLDRFDVSEKLAYALRSMHPVKLGLFFSVNGMMNCRSVPSWSPSLWYAPVG